MMWYGLNSRIFNNSKKKKSLYSNTKNWKFNKKILSYPNFRFLFFIPQAWNFIIFQNKSVNNFIFYFFSSNYYLVLPLQSNFIRFNYDRMTNTLNLSFLFKNNFYGLFFNFFKNIFYSFTSVFFKKLKFKGKGYYIYKNKRNSIALQFGYSHLLYLYSFFISIKFLSKTSVFLFGLNKSEIINYSKQFINVRPINIFTLKGVRFARQIIYRKTGKISTYR